MAGDRQCDGREPPGRPQEARRQPACGAGEVLRCSNGSPTGPPGRHPGPGRGPRASGTAASVPSTSSGTDRGGRWRRRPALLAAGVADARTDVLDISARAVGGGTGPRRPGVADADALRAIGIDSTPSGSGSRSRSAPARSTWPPVAVGGAGGCSCAGGGVGLLGLDWPVRGDSLRPPGQEGARALAPGGPPPPPHYIGTEHILLVCSGRARAGRPWCSPQRGIGLDDLRRRVLAAIGKVA